MFYKILKYTLLIVSCGFYTLHVAAYECPGHPRSAEEVEQEQREKQRKNDPTRELGNDEQKEQYDKGNGDWANKDFN